MKGVNWIRRQNYLLLYDMSTILTVPDQTVVDVLYYFVGNTFSLASRIPYMILYVILKFMLYTAGSCSVCIFGIEAVGISGRKQKKTRKKVKPFTSGQPIYAEFSKNIRNIPLLLVWRSTN